MSRTLNILVVEDSEDDAKIAMRVLKQGGLAVRHERVENRAALRSALERGGWDAVISDYRMPGFTGLEALEIFKACGLDLPFILVSGTIGESLAVEAMKAGASDYVMKQDLARLVPAIKRELKEAANRAAKRAAERALAESEHRLRVIIATEPECVKVVGADGRLLEMNPAGLAMLEVDSLAEAQARPLHTYLLAEHRAAFAALHQRVLRGESGMLAFEVEGRKGGRRWLETHAAPLPGANGEGSALLGITRDVTARRLAERDLRDSEERFRSLTALSSDWYWELDENLRFTRVEGAGIARIGLKAEAMIGKRATEFSNYRLLSMTPEAFEQLRTERRPYRDVLASFDLDDGARKYLRVSGEPKQDAAGNFTGYRGVTRDVTESQSAENELQRFRAALDVSEDAVILVDRNSMRYIDANRAMGEMTGYSRQEIIGMTPMDLFSADRPTLERDYDAIIADNNAAASRMEGHYRHRDGRLVPIETRRRAFKGADGWIIVGTARDITARRLADAKIRRLNRVYAVLSGINSLIVRARDRDELFREACRIVVEAGQFRVSWIGVVDRTAMKIRPVASAGAAREYLGLIADRFTLAEGTPMGDSLSVRALKDKKIHFSNDTQTDPAIWLKSTHLASGTKSIAVLPLQVGEEAVAVLALYSEESGYFDEEELKLLRELGGDLSFALDHLEKAARLDYLAFYDQLTGLANRTLFVERVNQSIHSFGQAEGKFAVAILDIERLTTVNESLGRQAGDALVKRVAERLRTAVGAARVGRIGADHLAMVLGAVKGRTQAGRILGEVLRSCFSAPFEIGGKELRIAAKAGVASFPGDGSDAESLLGNAEAALRKAKELGERHVLYTPALTARTAGQLTLENQLRQALEREEFVLHYQPKVDLETRQITGVEALIRWQSPALGLVPPMKFIPLMEESGLILEAGTWALKQAARDHRKWTGLGLKAPRVAVNVSPMQLRQRDFVDTVEQAILEGIAPTGIDLEITESLIMEDVQGSIKKLKAVRGLGVRLAIDDFGTGYSSLGYLARLPVRTLKIDRSFIITMLCDPDTMTLVSTIISLAHSLRLNVVAEGVDAEEQAKMLRLLRCDEMQGYLFSKPVPFEDMTALLRRG